MDFIRLLERLTFFLSAFFVAFCHGEADEYQSLLLTKTKTGYQLTLPNKLDPETNIGYFTIPKKQLTYRFCPDEKSYNLYSLHKVENITSNSDISESKICKRSVEALLTKVYNPGKLKKVDWNDQQVKLLHSGFLLYNNFVKKLGRMITSNFVRVIPDYGPYITWEKFIVLIEFYYNKELDRTIAVQYKLLSINIHYVKDMEIHRNLRLSTGAYNMKTPLLFHLTDTPDYVSCFQGTVEKEWIQKFLDISKQNPLSLFEFASFEHFPLTVWSSAAQFSFNFIPLWKITKLTWIRVEIFARTVARFIGDLTVTAGITGTMTLSNKEVRDVNGFKLPKYFWKIFQRYENGHVFGIIVVLNCNPFEKTEQKICHKEISCEENGWYISNKDYETGEIYCCRMTNGNIENLNVEFLSLKENKTFNLNNWLAEKMQIEAEYTEIISNEQYHTEPRHSGNG